MLYVLVLQDEVKVIDVFVVIWVVVSNIGANTSRSRHHTDGYVSTQVGALRAFGTRKLQARSASSRLSDLAQRVRQRTGPAEGSPDGSARS